MAAFNIYYNNPCITKKTPLSIIRQQQKNTFHEILINTNWTRINLDMIYPHWHLKEYWFHQGFCIQITTASFPSLRRKGLLELIFHDVMRNYLYLFLNPIFVQKQGTFLKEKEIQAKLAKRIRLSLCSKNLDFIGHFTCINSSIGPNRPLCHRFHKCHK